MNHDEIAIFSSETPRPVTVSKASSSDALSTKDLLYGLWLHLSRRRRWQLGVLLLVMLASGASEVFSLAAVLPFLAVLTDPEQLWRVPIVQQLASVVGVRDADGLLLPVTVLFGSGAVLAAAVRLANLWLNSRLAAAIGSDMSCEAYRRTLHQPYTVHVQRNSSGVITATTTHIAQTVSLINVILLSITAIVVAMALFGAIIVADWKVAFVASVVFGSAYGFLAHIARNRLATNSLLVAQAGKQQLKALQEGLGAIRDVLLDDTQSTYLEIYRKADRPLRLKQAQSGFISAFPRYALEALGLLVIALLTLLLSWQRGSSQAVIPTVGALALGFQRLLPALQQVYSGWALVRAFRSAVADVLAMLDQPMPAHLLQGKQRPLQLEVAVCLQQVSFRYRDDSPSVLHQIDLSINRGQRIGIIGSTGSGKSTLLDLLMGLLKPTSGTILVDGKDLYAVDHPERLLAWRSSIAHVPQSIYLADGSIAENIAFGLPSDQIDMARVRQAAEQAQIAGFIESIAEGYRSFVGERGIRLSGGQRQRIGIARALYKQAQVLVFDEATSALDTATEQAVMEAIEGLSKELTILMIAHRLSTLERCDRVIKLDTGGVVSDGPPGAVLVAD